jgi:cytochrome c oxidase subunit IV
MTEHIVSHGDEGAHAGPRTYWIILVALAVITLLEVGTYFVPWLHERLTLLFAILSLMAIAKFVLVVGWYMHLRYDALYYRRVFVVPLITATAMVVVVTVLTGLRFLL